MRQLIRLPDHRNGELIEYPKLRLDLPLSLWSWDDKTIIFKDHPMPENPDMDFLQKLVDGQYALLLNEKKEILWEQKVPEDQMPYPCFDCGKPAPFCECDHG